MIHWYSPTKIPESAIKELTKGNSIVWNDIGWDVGYWGPMPENTIILAGAERRI